MNYMQARRHKMILYIMRHRKELQECLKHNKNGVVVITKLLFHKNNLLQYKILM